MKKIKQEFETASIETKKKNIDDNKLETRVDRIIPSVHIKETKTKDK